jgi:hypothetical protein
LRVNLLALKRVSDCRGGRIKGRRARGEKKRKGLRERCRSVGRTLKKKGKC